MFGVALAHVWRHVRRSTGREGVGYVVMVLQGSTQTQHAPAAWDRGWNRVRASNRLQREQEVRIGQMLRVVVMVVVRFAPVESSVGRDTWREPQQNMQQSFTGLLTVCQTPSVGFACAHTHQDSLHAIRRIAEHRALQL